MNFRNYKTDGRPVVDINDYYRDDYEMLQDILSCRWSEVMIVGLRRFGKTSLLKRIEGFVNQREDYKKFLEKGLDGWNRETFGNPPRKEFFDEIKNLNAKAFYLTFLDSYDYIEVKILDFFREISKNIAIDTFQLERFEKFLPPRLFILMDEFSKLSEIGKEVEKKRELFLKLHRSAQNIDKEIVFIMAEPPSIFSTFESANDEPYIEEINEALQNRKIFWLNGLSPHEKFNLFCLKKSISINEELDEDKISIILDQLSGIPLEIQMAGESFFAHPERSAKNIIKDVAEAFGGNLKSIFHTMNLQQRIFVRLLVEFEIERDGLPWELLKKNSQKIYESLRNFGIVKKENDSLIHFTSEPIRTILCDEIGKLSLIVEDETFNKESKIIFKSDDEKQNFIPGSEPWDGRIRIHHFSDLALGDLIKGFRYNENTSRLDLFSMNNKENPFEAYIRLLKSHPKYKPQILIFTGDIAISHHSYCYRGLKEFIAEILELMSPLPGQPAINPKKQIFIVPGEMDISNTEDRKCNENHPDDTSDYCNFVDFFRAFKDYGLPPENALDNSLEKLVTIELPPTHGIPRYNLEILPFNSATMIWSGQSNSRRLELLNSFKKVLESNIEEQIKEEFDNFLGEEIGYLNLDRLKKETDKNENMDDTLRIALTHHNFNPLIIRGNSCTLDTYNAHDAKTILLKNCFSIVLHGHQRLPIFIKETLYLKDQKEKKGLKTLFMNGAGKFTVPHFDVDNKTDEGNPFGSSFNCYDIRRIDNRNDERGKYRGDFIVYSTVFSFNEEENKFSHDFQPVKEEIYIDED